MANVLASYIQGQQAVENSKRNRLLDMQIDDAPAQQQRANRLADLNLQGKQQEVDAGAYQQKQAQELEGLKRGIAGAQYVAQAQSPKAEAEARYPDFVQQYKAGGGDWDSLDDEGVRGMADHLVEQLSARAGVGPAKKQAQFTTEQGPRGSLIQVDPSTGERKQVVGPDNTEAVRRSTFRPATAEEIRAKGLPEGASGQVDEITGQFHVVNKPDQNLNFQRADKLRDEYNALTKDFRTVADSYERIKSVGSDTSPAGDLALIFSYMKVLDPTSAVREQEFANAQNAAGIPDRIRAAYNRALTGERLPPKQRADFLNQSKNLFNAQDTRQKVIRKRYENIAKKFSVDPSLVLGDDESSATPLVATAQPMAQQQTPGVAESSSKPRQIATEAEYGALQSGDLYIGPDGKTRRKR